MSAAHAHDAEVFQGQSAAYRRALWAVIAINAGMFLIEVFGGVFAKSQSLQADALDFLGDAITYGLSLAVLGMSQRTRALAALGKGISLMLMALWVVGSTGYQVFILDVPRADVMGSIGFLALIANLTSVLLLLRYRDGDANVRSVWLCSRNDAIGNALVIIAAAGVWGSATAWPDLVVAAGMASLFLWSSVQIIGQARREMRGEVCETKSGCGCG